MSILDAFRLEGKVALVTGAGQGLGQGISVALAEAGADIVGLDRGQNFDDTTAKIEALGRRFFPISQDLSQISADVAQNVVGQAAKSAGRLDILVNNAGIIRRSPAVDFAEQDWDDVIQINLKAVFLLSQAAGRLMHAQRSGKIINIASMLSFQGGILVPSYTAAKSAVAGLTRALANEWAGAGLNINAIAPGYMATDNTAQIRADEARNKAILDRIPAGRWGTPDDLKGIAVFLASGASDYLNGAVIPVDGGWLAR